MKKSVLYMALLLIAAMVSACGGNYDFLDDNMNKSFVAPGEPSGNDALSASTNRSDKEGETAPRLDPLAGAAYVKQPVIGNYGTVNLSYPMDTPGGRAGMQPGVGLSYSSSGGDGLAGIGWSLGTGLAVISRTTRNGELYYDWRDEFSFNGQRLIKVDGSAGAEEGTYRLEIESGFSRFELADIPGGGVWRVYDKSGTVTVLGEDRSSRVYRPDDPDKTYIWNFSRTTDLNGNYMYAVYDGSEYEDKHILYLSEIRYTGNVRTGQPARQYVRFAYKERDEAYVSKAPGFPMIMDRLLDRVEMGWDAPGLMGGNTKLWDYTMVYEESQDSHRPLLVTVESSRTSTKPAFRYQDAEHQFVWHMANNPRVNDPEVNPDSTQYFEGDFNGDGISDMVFFNPETGDWRAAQARKEGGYTFPIYGNMFKGYDSADMIQFFKGNVTGDYNGDGRSDIAMYLPGSREFWVAEHDGRVFRFERYGRLESTAPDLFSCEWFPGDFDGNGLSDTLLYDERTGEWTLMRNLGGSFEFRKFAVNFKNLFRDDYRPDQYLNSASTQDESAHGKDRDKAHFLSGDFNGDGRTDISVYDSRTGRWIVGENWRSANARLGFEIRWRLYAVFKAPQQALFGNDRFSGDFDGNGYSDFLMLDRDTGDWLLGKTGDRSITFRVFSKMPQYKEITRWLQGDFNGDGRTDIGFYSATDQNFWIGEATPDGFRYRIYSNMKYGPDPERVLEKAPLPRDEVTIAKGTAVVSMPGQGTTDPGQTEIVKYEYNDSFHEDRGEKVFAGYFDGVNPGLLVFDRETDGIYYQPAGGILDESNPLAIDLDDSHVKVMNNGVPVQNNGYGCLAVYDGRSGHRVSLIKRGSSDLESQPVSAFKNSDLPGFDINSSLYFLGEWNNVPGMDFLALDSSSGAPDLIIPGSDNGRYAIRLAEPVIVSMSAFDDSLFGSLFADYANHRGALQFYVGDFNADNDTDEIVMAYNDGDMQHWFIGTIDSENQFVFSEMTVDGILTIAGQAGPYHVTGNEIIVPDTSDGVTRIHRINIAPGTLMQEYTALIDTFKDLDEGMTFNNEYDSDGNPLVHTAEGLSRIVLGISGFDVEPIANDDNSVPTRQCLRPDLYDKYYPFRWIQGDYNGDGKTDIGIFHLKEKNWYFALTRGTVPDMLSEVDNGIGGTYSFEYENSTRFDNTGDDDIPDLPMNYKVCVKQTANDGRGNKIVTKYEYADGCAFSEFINGCKETDYFGFGTFKTVDSYGGRTINTYYAMPYDDYRLNRALAGAIRESRFVGGDNIEHSSTGYDYTVRVITPPGAPTLIRAGTVSDEPARSYLIEPTAVRTHREGTLVQTAESAIVLAQGEYSMISRTTKSTDHYDDAAHDPVTVSARERFENNDDTNEMRLVEKNDLYQTAYERTTTYRYDERGNLTREVTAYTGSGLGQADDRIMRYEYDDYGNRVRTTDASGSPGRVTEQSFDDALHQFAVESRSIGDIVLATTYGINYATVFGAAERVTDPNGRSTYFEFDSFGRLARQYADIGTPKQLLAEYSYAAGFPLSAKATRRTGTTDPDLSTRVYADGMGRAIHSVSSMGTVPGRRYVKTGLVKYDALGRVLSKSQTAWAGDDEIDEFEANGDEKHPTLTEYDGAGRVAKITLPRAENEDRETSIQYAYNGAWETVETHSAGRSKRTIVNGRGQVLYVEDFGPSTGTSTGLSAGSGTGEMVRAAIGFAYDMAGNRVKKMDLATPFDSAQGAGGMNTSMPTPPSPLTGGAGWNIPEKDSSGNNIAFWWYDGFGRVIASSDPDLGFTGIIYNEFGDVETRTDARGLVTSMAYDRLGRLTAKTLPGSEGVTVVTYDTLAGSENCLGRVASVEDAVQRKEFSYDELGRVVRETRTIKDVPFGSAQGATFVTDFEHDLVGRTASIEYPPDPTSGRSVTLSYAYLPAGVSSVTADTAAGTKSIISATEYNEFGQMTVQERGNGTSSTYEYDIKGRLMKLTSVHGDTLLQNVTYGFNTDNSIASREEELSGRGTRFEYTYDGLNRLVRSIGRFSSATMPENAPTSPLSPDGVVTPNPPQGGGLPLTPTGGTNGSPLPGGGTSVNPDTGMYESAYERGYSYAPNGNLTAKRFYDPGTHSIEETWTYSYANHAATGISSSVTGTIGINMEYDESGNMTTQAFDASTGSAQATQGMVKRMAYDSMNRVCMVTDETNTLVGQYWYDEQGLRVRKIGRVSASLDNQGNVTEEHQIEVLYPSMYFGVERQRTADGQLIPNTSYAVNNVYVNGVRIAAIKPDGAARYYLTDQVDSVKVVLDDTGKAITRFEYLPYGEEWITESDTGIDEQHNPKYNGQELDRETGYYYYNARYYDPEISRFTTADNVIDGQYSTQGWNRYMYCHGNPIVYKDPTGHTMSKQFDDLVDNICDAVHEKTDSNINYYKNQQNEGSKEGGVLGTLKKINGYLGEKTNSIVSAITPRGINDVTEMMFVGGVADQAIKAAGTAVSSLVDLGTTSIKSGLNGLRRITSSGSDDIAKQVVNNVKLPKSSSNWGLEKLRSDPEYSDWLKKWNDGEYKQIIPTEKSSRIISDQNLGGEKGEFILRSSTKDHNVFEFCPETYSNSSYFNNSNSATTIKIEKRK